MVQLPPDKQAVYQKEAEPTRSMRPTIGEVHPAGTDQFVRDNQEFPDLAPDWELDWDRHLYCRVVEFAKAAAVVVAAAGRAVAVVVAA